MILRCWGVRGSIPSPGDSTVRHGGNTSCVSIEFGTHTTLVLDAGSGIRMLGHHLNPLQSEIFILLTHYHSDHIQGFPFFSPLFQKDRAIHLIPCPVDNGRWSLLQMIDGFHFPLEVGYLPSRINESAIDARTLLAERGITVDQIATNHPGGAYGYRIEHEGRAVVFIPDNELEPPYPVTTTMEDLANFCRDADVLLHDSQYIERDLPMKWGWGHSTAAQACRLAHSANVRRLLLFHHDPDRADDELDAIEWNMRTWFGERQGNTECISAHEGLTLEL